ncbi:MAG: biopolymer transporter ExbD [Phycisphaerae bacterium]|nr:biopolymer transporter ExbD [Phycisphaerae bacterium]
MTPMIDVIFLLLTFFVLTAEFQKPEHTLPFSLRKTGTHAAAVPNETVKIYIKSQQNTCLIDIDNRLEITLDAQNPQQGLLMLAQNIQQITENFGAVPIELYCQDSVLWDYVVKIYDVLYALGAYSITFRIEE